MNFNWIDLFFPLFQIYYHDSKEMQFKLFKNQFDLKFVLNHNTCTLRTTNKIW